MFASLKKQPFIKMAQLSTLIAEGVEITGDLLFTNGMRIDGRVKGDITGRPARRAAARRCSCCRPTATSKAASAAATR